MEFFKESSISEMHNIWVALTLILFNGQCKNFIENKRILQ